MKKLIRVKVADLHTPRDEYGNEFQSREFDQKVNEDYVKELADSFKADGEPDVPLSLVDREEGGYYVADGQSRMRALQLRGTEECWGVLDDEATVRDVIETIVRTNKKKRYEPVEESRAVQQLAAFGDDAYVSDVASIDVDKAARLRKAREIIGERAEQLSLDRLYVVPDFEGDEEAIEKLTNAPEERWERVADDLRRVKRLSDQRDAFIAAAKELEVELTEEYPGGGGRRYICRCLSPEDFGADFMAARVEHTDIVAQLNDGWHEMYVCFYGKPLNWEEESAEEAERRRKGEEYKETAQRIDDACFNWVLEQFSETGSEGNLALLPMLDEACRKVALHDWPMKNALKMFPQAKKEENCLTLFAIGYTRTRETLAYYADNMADETPSDYIMESMQRALKWVELHIADGWQPDEGMRQFIDLVREKVDGYEAEPDDVDEDEDDFDDDDYDGEE